MNNEGLERAVSAPKVSVIVTTYRSPYALRAVLTALSVQKTEHTFEIIIADAGSGEDTTQVITGFKKRLKMPVLHILQTDEGYRTAAIRNKAILAAAGDYLIFLSGDCIPREDFIERHVALAEPKVFVVGNRVLLNKTFTVKVLSEALPLHQWPMWRWGMARVLGQTNRFLPLLLLSLKWWNRKTTWRWKGANGCNLAVWKADLLQINGWEELFVGGGFEDLDVAFRLLKAGVYRKSGRFQVPVIHLWHPKMDKERQKKNGALFKARQNTSEFCSVKGVTQYGVINV